MSLDVYVQTKCEHCGVTTEWGAFNYTYNLGQLWRDALTAVGRTPASQTSAANEAFGADRGLSFGAWLEEMGNKGPAGAAVETLDAMLRWMASIDLSKYGASNGWGDGEGGRRFVQEIRDCCAEHPKAQIRVWR